MHVALPNYSSQIIDNSYTFSVYHKMRERGVEKVRGARKEGGGRETDRQTDRESVFDSTKI